MSITEKKTEQIDYIVKEFYRLRKLSEIARDLGITKQRVKFILDKHVSKREQNYVKSLRSAYLQYKQKVKIINQNYGKLPRKSRASQQENQGDEGSSG